MKPGRSGVLLVVVDTNVWISGLLNPSGPPGRVLAAAHGGQFEVAFTESTLDELRSVARRRRLVEKFGLRPEEVRRLSNLLLDRGHRLPPEIPVPSVSRDPRDDIFIAAAAAANADVLVTRDDDLKRDSAVAAFFEGRDTEVLSVRQFLERLEAES